ncbi:uncharacterized protein B0I36DRAFT_403875 [Microdochium trichocladiopsis]|uniref:AAA+ ATPase domain-containing protein n=1 Tax=Microdochium trichocladiopsis TaxID=1682393 RepID=A0A9P9BYQ0_9PEZI|nr:uncharacterized protein B0I36DRAFT_403875 [Microdochium trichocladiopsis]KAH7038263.1 hypothetical protein B0I36DRAFT_403875 [Microdochium trichocladiopsis]
MTRIYTKKTMGRGKWTTKHGSTARNAYKAASNGGGQSPVETAPPRMPEWFLENCVKTIEELRNKDSPGLIPLEIIDTTETKAQPSSEQGDIPHHESYQIDRLLWAPIRGLLAPLPDQALSEISSNMPNGGVVACHSCAFLHDAAHIRFPGRRVAGGNPFLLTIAQRLAPEAGAHLIVLTLEDVDDLCEHLAREGFPAGSKLTRPPLKAYFTRTSETEEDTWYPKEDYSKPWKSPFPFSALLHCADVIEEGDVGNPRTGQPVVVWLPDVKKFWDYERGIVLQALKQAVAQESGRVLVLSTVDQMGRPSSFTGEPLPPPLQRLPQNCAYPYARQDVRESRPDTSSSDDSDYEKDEFGESISKTSKVWSQQRNKSRNAAAAKWEDMVLSASGTNPRRHAIHIAPVSSSRQRRSFEINAAHRPWTMEDNIRRIQAVVRRSSPIHAQSPLFRPYAAWERMTDSLPQDHPICADFLGEPMLMDLASSIMPWTSEDRIRLAILEFQKYESVLRSWSPSTLPEDQTGLDSKLTPQIRKKLERLFREPQRYTWAIRLLSLLQAQRHKEVRMTDLALPDEVRQSIAQLAGRPDQAEDQAPYGTLAQETTSGALLYGPPGNGKTSLARALASQTNGVFLSFSAADIKARWFTRFGYQFKELTHSLFWLARELKAAVLFIDEADQLYGPQSDSSYSPDSSLSPQLLQEMSKRQKHNQKLLVLLATNQPHKMDPVLLGRFPTRIYMGLPSPAQRLQILQLHLSEESLDHCVDLSRLADKTMNYSASDIKDLCKHAAVLCDSFDGDLGGRRLLQQRHFDRVLLRTPTTVSLEALSSIRAFAKQHDPEAWRSMMSRTQVATNPGAASTTADAAASHQNRTHDPTLSRAAREQRQKARREIGTSNPQPSAPPHEPNPEGADLAQTHLAEGGAVLPERRRSYQYTPLAQDGKHIRVLHICAEDCEVEGHNTREGANALHDDTIVCMLSTVDLDDTTEAWTRYTSVFDFPPQTRIVKWQSACRDAEEYQQDLDSPQPDKTQDIDDGAGVASSSRGKMLHRYRWGDFMALSYVWGDAARMREIIVDGCRFDVTSNLYEALSVLRGTDEIRKQGLHIWIDAICINQQDKLERAREVMRMDLIYANCFKVWAQLDSGSAVADSDVNIVKARLERLDFAELPDLRWGDADTIAVEDALWSVVTAMATNRYWERLWVVQEIALAPDITFRLGAGCFTRKDILDIDIIYRAASDSQRTSRDTESKKAWDLYRKMTIMVFRLVTLRPKKSNLDVSGRPMIDMIEILHLAQTSSATDPRDKVFGMLGLVPVEVKNAVKPDYRSGVSMQEVAVQFSKACILADGELNNFARMQRNAVRPRGLPTWAMDLEGSPHMGKLIRDTQYRVHDANQGLAWSDLKFTDNDRVMVCQGVMVDDLAALGACEWFYEPLDGWLYRPLWQDTEDGGNDNERSKAEQDPDTMKWRQTLARVLLRDSTFTFDDGKYSVLDIPWLESYKVEKDYTDARATRHLEGPPADIGRQHFAPQERKWARFYNKSGLNGLFYSALNGSADLLIGGQPLKSYFALLDSNDECPDIAAFLDLTNKLDDGLCGEGYTRLLKTKRGLLGTVPEITLPGDKIVVLSQCDMPMVLRPKDGSKYYEIVGSCFVEGLMRGETAELLAQGTVKLETFMIR